MTTRRIRVLLLFTVAALFPLAAPAQVDFSKYVAIGDSLTAGFMSGGLVADDQQYSYPALLARQFGITDFEQPWISQPGIPTQLVLQSLVPDVVLNRDHDGDGTDDAPGQPFNLFLPRPYDNLGIPGAAARHMVHVPPPGDPDRPFFYDLVVRGDLLQDGTEDTVLEQAVALEPTFITVWIGANDVLGAAASGCDDTITNLDPSWFCPPTDQFHDAFDALIDGLAATNAKLAIANVPDVLVIPFMQFMPETVVDDSGQEFDLYSADRLNSGLPFPEKVTASDLVLPAARCYLDQGCGLSPKSVGQPLPPTMLGFPSNTIEGCEGPPGAPEPFVWDCSGGYMPTNAVLRVFEAKPISDALQAMNAHIAAKAAEVGAALVDANAFFEKTAAEGVHLGGIDYDTSFISGGLFSYDGVHPTRLGYALVANLFIDTINAYYGTSVPEVDLRPFVFGGLSPGPTPPVPSASVAMPAGMPQLFTGGRGFEQAPATSRRLERQRALQRLRTGRAEPPRRRTDRHRTGRRAHRPRR